MSGNKAVVFAGAALLALAACDDAGTADPVPMDEPMINTAAAPEATPEPLGPEPTKVGDPDQVLGAETVEAVFDGFEVGDLVWAKFSNPVRRDIRALVDTTTEGLEHFLSAHEGRPMTVRLESVRTFVEPAGGVIEAQKVVGAKTLETSAEAWWQTLGEEERNAARGATERMMTAPQ